MERQTKYTRNSTSAHSGSSRGGIILNNWEISTFVYSEEEKEAEQEEEERGGSCGGNGHDGMVEIIMSQFPGSAF